MTSPPPRPKYEACYTGARRHLLQCTQCFARRGLTTLQVWHNPRLGVGSFSCSWAGCSCSASPVATSKYPGSTQYALKR